MTKENEGLDSTPLIAGFVLGLLAGVVAALFRTPSERQPIGQQISETGTLLRNKLEAITQADPISESLAEGKAAARQRRAELGRGQ